MSITHNIEKLTEKQKSDLVLAKTLLLNINSVRDTEHTQVKLHYSDNKFSISQTGYQHSFLIKDIQLAIEGDFQNHKNFILDIFQKQVDEYLQSSRSIINRKHLLNSESQSLFKYYGIGSDIIYPKYSDEPMFQIVLENVEKTIAKLLK
ncbi:hypothetical protein G1K72_11480 [Tenacibaculum finnmarkense]|uniref:hypothetical protein n=1 Tax=Tenacibaculum finnmarkense TaxID=2781243 RepID=UPI001EFA4F09|nr:hypothetical protein [Tenacibaculum finnmarkense]MCG8821414.1 hypothetical protein [Tenacibaculum finnmarkense]